jgi:hypothetical protein
MRRDALPGIVFWATALPLLAFGTTHQFWYDTWSLAERINFWVAIGTGALAIVTAGSVLATMAVMGSEDRRHRESLAPLCIAILERADIYVQNIGLGPAVSVVVHGVVSYDIPMHEPDESGQNSATLRINDRNKGTSSFHTPPLSVVPAVAVSPGARENGRIVGGAWATPVWSQEELRNKLLYSGEISNIRDLGVSYTDMFGNRYETLYWDLESERYEWVRPSRFV